MNAADLVTIGNVKDWLSSGAQVANPTGTFPTGSDQLLGRLVTATSRMVVSYLQRNIQPANYVETYNGDDTREIMLRNSPVLSVSSLVIGTTAVTARTQVGSYGYAFDSTSLYLSHTGFWRGVQNVAVSYRAGYQASDTTAVPATGPLTVSQLSRPWNSDQGITYASTGIAFTPVTVAPTVAGTYQISTDTAGSAQYLFDSADANTAIVVTYGYTPEDIAQAVIEIVGERFLARSRIGETSKNIGHGQTVALSREAMNSAVKLMLQPYRQIVPIQ